MPLIPEIPDHPALISLIRTLGLFALYGPLVEAMEQPAP